MPFKKLQQQFTGNPQQYEYLVKKYSDEIVHSFTNQPVSSLSIIQKAWFSDTVMYLGYTYDNVAVPFSSLIEQDELRKFDVYSVVAQTLKIMIDYFQSNPSVLLDLNPRNILLSRGPENLQVDLVMQLMPATTREYVELSQNVLYFNPHLQQKEADFETFVSDSVSMAYSVYAIVFKW